MSYVPIIYVRKKDLEVHEGKFQEVVWNSEGHTENLVYACTLLLNTLANGDLISFSELEFYVISTEYLSEKNKAVRSLLNDLGIEYKLSD